MNWKVSLPGEIHTAEEGGREGGESVADARLVGRNPCVHREPSLDR